MVAQKFDPMRVLEVFGSDPFFWSGGPAHIKSFFMGLDLMHFMPGSMYDVLRVMILLRFQRGP